MTTEALPAWKQALLDRKKKKEDEELRKKQEEEAKLKALPLWKQQLVKRKQQQNASPAESSNTTVNEPQANRPTSPDHFFTSTFSNTAPVTDRPAPSRPSPKLIHRAKVFMRSNEVSTNKEEKNERLGKKVPTDRPPQKKSNLEGKHPKSPGGSKIPGDSKTPGMNKSTSAPATANQHPSHVNLTNGNAEDTRPARAQPTQVTKTEAKNSSHRSADMSTARPNSTSRSCGEAEQMNGPLSPKPLEKQVQPTDTASSSNLKEDQAFAKLPLWKQQLIQRKRGKNKQPKDAEEVDPPPKSGEPPKSATPPPTSSSGQAKKTLSGSASAPSLERRDPLPVNSKQARKQAKPRNNPEDLIPPVFKLQEPWAHVSQKDPSFLSQPSWKQALIRRRQTDYEKRSHPTEYLKDKEEKESEDEESNEPDIPKDIWSPTDNLSRSSLRQVSTSPQKGDPEEDKTIPPWKLDVLRNKRLKEHLEHQKDLNSSSSTHSHHKINVGSSSPSDSAEFEDEEELYTNIDDLSSDEEYLCTREKDDVPKLPNVMLRTESSSSVSSTSSKSILVDPKKKASSVS